MKRLALYIVCLTCVFCNCIAQTASLCIKDKAQQNRKEALQSDSMREKNVPSYCVTYVESTHRLRWTGKTFIGKHKDKANTWLIKAVIKGMINESKAPLHAVPYFINGSVYVICLIPSSRIVGDVMQPIIDRNALYEDVLKPLLNEPFL